MNSATDLPGNVWDLLQLCELWKRLDWPVPAAAYAFVFNLTDVSTNVISFIPESPLSGGNRPPKL